MPYPCQQNHAPAHRELSEAQLVASIGGGRVGSRILTVPNVASTNTYLLEYASDLPDGTIVCAEQQTGGRGRLGRPWHAPRGSSILLSVLLYEPADSLLLQHAATLAALATCEAIRNTTECDCRVRWPNDLVIGRRKVGGVLAESAPLPAHGDASRRAVVIGVGINCLQQRGHFSGELIEKATSLEIESSRAIERAAVAAALVERLKSHVTAAASPNYSQFLLAAWRELTSDIGQRATLVHNGQTYAGTIIDIDDAGDLVVQLDVGGRSHFAAATTTRHW